jgi:cytoskeletal protein CcmA (bactofilin family)
MFSSKRDEAPKSSGSNPALAPVPAPTPAGTPTGEVNAMLGRGASFEGKLTFEGVVRIEGRFKGQILANDTLIIGDDGVVEGEISVGELICSGTIRGTIRAERAVELRAPGRVEAEVTTASLHIERGVTFDGQVHMKHRDRG